MKATIHEQGNGLPGVGDYVPGDDGNLYRVTKTGRTQTGDPGSGCSNWMFAEVELADWDDVEEEDEFPARAQVQNSA